MLLETRLIELCEAGNRKDAADLAKAALTNDPVRSVTIADGEVVVDTEWFRGTHRLRRDGERLQVDQQGTYRYKHDEVDLSFSTATMNDEAYRRVREELLAVQAEAGQVQGVGNADDQQGASAASTAEGPSWTADGRRTAGERGSGRPGSPGSSAPGQQRNGSTDGPVTTGVGRDSTAANASDGSAADATGGTTTDATGGIAANATDGTAADGGVTDSTGAGSDDDSADGTGVLSWLSAVLDRFRA